MIFSTEAKVKCDIRDCKNQAEVFVPCKGKTGRFFLCKQCLESFCNEAMKRRTPKSPKNTIKKMLENKDD